MIIFASFKISQLNNAEESTIYQITEFDKVNESYSLGTDQKFDLAFNIFKFSNMSEELTDPRYGKLVVIAREWSLDKPSQNYELDTTKCQLEDFAADKDDLDQNRSDRRFFPLTKSAENYRGYLDNFLCINKTQMNINGSWDSA